MTGDEKESLRRLVKWTETTMRCNCNLDNWVPEEDTGHSWVCRIHKHAKQMHKDLIAGRISEPK